MDCELWINGMSKLAVQSVLCKCKQLRRAC